MTARSVLQVFDQYQKARIQFVQTVADLALRPQNIEYLDQAGALDLLRPLLNDVCIQIQQCAAIAIGRIVHHEARLAKQVLNRDFLPLLLRDIDKQNKYYKKAALFVLRSLCKHDEEMASIVVSSGGMEALMICMEDFEPMVKQGAAWAIGYIARHSQNLAQIVVDSGVIPLLILSLQEPELSLKQVATNAVADIAKHSSDLAQSVVDAGAIPHIARSLNNQDEKLKRQVLMALSSIAKHSNELAEVVVEAEVFPSVLIHMAHACPIVRKNAASLVRDIVKHSLELTQLVVNTGGIGALMETLRHPSEESKVPCITAIGYIAGHSDQLSMSVLGCNGVLELTQILNNSGDDATLAVSAWALRQIGKHSPEHAKAVAAANAFPRLLFLYTSANSSEDLKTKCKNTLKQCLQKCMLLSALEPLLFSAPVSILKYILGQFSKVKSKAIEKLLTMLTTPYDTSATPQFSNMVYYDSKLNGSDYLRGSAEDTSQSSDVILNATPITNSETAQEELVSSFKSEAEDAEPACSDDPSFETYQLPLMKSSEKSDHKGYKRKLNHLLEEMHNFVKKKSDDSQWKKKLYNIKTEQAEVELQIKKVELEIKIQELEIRKKELELKTKELEIKNKELEQYAHSN